LKKYKIQEVKTMKLDGQAVVKYLALGAGAVALPAAVMSFGIGATLSSIPFWGQAIWEVTVGDIVLGGVGVGLVDHLFFNK
jgi:hypothetical protein